MKILFITSKLNFKTAGGSIEEIDLMIRTLRSFGHDVSIVTAFSSANVIPDELPYRVYEEELDSSKLLTVQRQVFHLLKKYEDQTDMFHIDGHFFLYGAGMYRRLGGKIPVTAFFNRELMCWPEDESSLFPKQSKPLWKQVKKSFRWLAEKYIGMPIASGIDVRTFISPQYRELYLNFGLSRNAANLVIGDPIDFEKIMREGGVERDSYLKRNKTKGPYIIFYSSRMAPGKGFDMLLTGFSRVKNKEDFRLILGGSGPEEEHVKNMIRDLHLEPYVELPGWVSKEELYANYRRADMFIQADWRLQGTSISLLYAMAFGVPSVLFGGGGFEWVAGKSALYFPYRNPDELARAIEKLTADRERRATLSRECYRRIDDDEMNYREQMKRVEQAMLEVRSRIDQKGYTNTGPA